MSNAFEEVQRTEALLRDAVRLLSEPATTYSKNAAAAVVVESLRLYRRALERQRAARRALDGTAQSVRYSWQGSLAELSAASASSLRVPAALGRLTSAEAASAFARNPGSKDPLLRPRVVGAPHIRLVEEPELVGY